MGENQVMKRIHCNLLILGIALGVIAAVLVFGVGQTMMKQQVILNNIRIKAISFYKIYFPYKEEKTFGIQFMSLKDAEAIKKLLEGEAKVSISSPIYITETTIKSGDEILDANITITDHIYYDFDLLKLEEGRFISKEDYVKKEKVCVINNNLYSYLGLKNRPNDNIIEINNISYKIIGVFTTSTSTEGVGTDLSNLSGIDYDKAIFIPATTAYEYIFNVDEYSAMIQTLIVKITEEKDILSIKNILSSTKDQDIDLSRFVIGSGLEQTEAYFKEQIKVFIVFFTTSLLILIIAGLNIIQIASASVIDTKREIGLKMALGATHKDIFLEIISKVLLCSLKGGYIGVALSGIIHTQLNRHFNIYLASFNVATALFGTILALITGLITSLIPAKQAVQLNPIQVLRQE